MKFTLFLLIGFIFGLSIIVPAQTTKKTITNMDLDKYRERREKADADYRENYKKLGMPSPEELEQMAKEDQRQREELSQRLAFEKQQNGSYYQARAAELRNQVISIDAQIGYLNGLIANTPNQNSIFVSPDQLNAVGVISYSAGNGGYRGRPGMVSRGNTANIANNVQAARNAAASAPNPYYGTPLYQTGIKAVIGQPNGGRGGYRGGNGGYGGYGGYYGGYPYTLNAGSYGRDQLISQVRYLQQIRAGLTAQWDELADQARRAGFRID